MSYVDEIEIKIISGKELTESELEDFALDYGEYEIVGDMSRWSVPVRTVCQLIDEEFYALDWEKGLTEIQDNYFGSQPYRVYKHEYDKTVHVVEYTKEP